MEIKMLWIKFVQAVIVICLVHSVHMAEYQHKAILDDFIPSDGSLYTTTTRSKLECSTRCDNVTGLQSCFFVSDSKACECHGTTYAATNGLISAPSAKYYEKKGVVFSCPPDSNSFRPVVLSNGVQFKYRALVDTFRSFDEAVANCTEEGATLLEIITVTKMNFYLQLMTCPEYQTSQFWINGVKNATTFLWETLGGVPLPMSSTFWAPNKPDGTGAHACVRMNPLYGHTWDDKQCKHEPAKPVLALCEMPYI